MKRLFTFNIGRSPEAELLKNLLDEEGISFTMRNEQLATALGGIPIGECYPEVWILKEEDFPRAKELLEGWLNPQSPTRSAWVCDGCGEKMEEQFTSCWKCGKERQECGLKPTPAR